MANITVQRAGRGLPGIPRQRTRKAPAAPKFLEVTVVYRDGRNVVELTEHNCPRGRRTIDDWAGSKLLDPAVDYIAVDLVDRRAQEGGSWR